MESSKWQGSVAMPVAAPLESVWEIVSDYYELQKWFPGMKSCERVEGAPHQGVGCIRHCTIPSPSEQDGHGTGSWVTEKLIALDRTNRSHTYVITDTNMEGFLGFQATFQLMEGGEGEEGKCVLKWDFQLRELLPGHSEEDVMTFLSSTLSGMGKKLEEIVSSEKH